MQVPFKALQYTTGECNYGGRVTDDHDRTCLNSILRLIYDEPILADGYTLSPSGLYKVPRGSNGLEGYWEAIQRLPFAAAPEVSRSPVQFRSRSSPGPGPGPVLPISDLAPSDGPVTAPPQTVSRPTPPDALWTPS